MSSGYGDGSTQGGCREALHGPFPVEDCKARLLCVWGFLFVHCSFLITTVFWGGHPKPESSCCVWRSNAILERPELEARIG